MKPGSDYLSYISKDIDGLPEEIEAEKLKFFGNFQQNEYDLTDDRKLFDWASRQVYIPFANMMTAAAQIGIDSCPIEGFDKNKVETLLSEEGVLDSEHLGVAAMAAFGYRKADSPFPNTRQPLENIVEWIR